ncbi:serine-rich coiled-coil domain-containing protein 2 isoform X1 [Clarias gariepinus]|uniref:serine-rich coiled-coil domain-containing protein 2 isoform X1 n=1 Tax=Clarias gariepinus TaxID=13013 RepID=UPI00234DB95B|nr:serine-rich coiled-coil domain-containing protein 2 isoform X1 [Clarias gariepinus]
MEDTALKQPIMVSRLPKFGSRATPAAGPLTNGSSHTVSPAGAKGVPVGKQNGVIRLPAPVALNGRKGREESGENVTESGEESRVVLRSQQQQQQPRATGTVRQIRKPSAAPVAKTQRSIPTVPSTIPRIIAPPTKTNPQSTAPKQPSSLQPLGSKLGVGVVAASQSSSSSSAQGSLQSSLSHSSDSLKSLSVENAVRSQSFSYLKRPAAPTNPPLTRSFSFNRATELAKELPRPLAQSPVARPPVTQPSTLLDRVAKPTVAACPISSLPSSTLKKSLLPNCTDGKPLSLSYKLMRPSFIKQPRSVVPIKVQGKAELTETDEDSGEKPSPVSEPSTNTHSEGAAHEEPFSTKEGNEGHAPSLEILEDMSLSSTSSLERNDVSEEYMDDFDDLGNGGGILLLPLHERHSDHMGLFKDAGLVGQCEGGTSVTSLHSFVSETVDWAKIGFSARMAAADACGTRGLSAEGDLAHGSSLELSPSDSSGGTYMWDEEVLEPIGRTAPLCASFDSNLNSMDILNNLDNLDSCDLEDDDLMLDVDLPEDVSLHSDVDVSPCYDHSEGSYWPWRKRQQCRGMGELLHFQDRDGVLQSFDNGPMLSLSRSGSEPSSLDELMLKHMTQDCVSVKEQLFHLRTLLQMEEDGESERFVSSSSSEEPSYQQVDELLKEVQKLREELRGKDILISALTQQLSAPVAVTPCLCQQGAPQRRAHQDKSTQTPWRAQKPQILQPSQPLAREHNKSARPSLPALSEAPSDRVDAQLGDGPVKPQSCTVVPVSATSNAALPSSVPATAPAVSAAAASLSSSTPNSDNLMLLLNTRLQIDGPHIPRAQVSNHIQLRRTTPHLADPRAPGDRKAHVLLKPRGDERAALGRGGRGAFGVPSRIRCLPPPSRGLPCISAVSQSSLTPSVHGVRTVSAPRDEEISSARAQDQSHSCNSRLPKPKSH